MAELSAAIEAFKSAKSRARNSRGKYAETLAFLAKGLMEMAEGLHTKKTGKRRTKRQRKQVKTAALDAEFVDGQSSGS